MSKVHGVVVIDKPTGMTSHDCVARVRRMFGTKKVGHTGTLDPEVMQCLADLYRQRDAAGGVFAGAAETL